MKKKLDYNPGYKSTLFKDNQELRLFFQSSHITLTRSKQYFIKKGILPYSYTKEGLAQFAQELFLGTSSLKELEKYCELRANPAVSGFAIKVSNDKSTQERLKDILDLLNSKLDTRETSTITDYHDPMIIIPEVKGRITNVFEMSDYIEGNIEYMTYKKGISIFETSVRNARFKVSSFKEYLLIYLVENRDTDYRTVQNLFFNLLDGNKTYHFTPISINIFSGTTEKHRIFSELVNEISNNDDEVEIYGAIKYYSDRADDIQTDQEFERAHRRRNNEIDILPLEKVIESLKIRKSCVYGINLVFSRLKDLFILKIVFEGNKFEIQLIDIRNILDEDTTKLKTIDDIQDLETVNITESDINENNEKYWKIIASKYLTNLPNDFTERIN